MTEPLWTVYIGHALRTHAVLSRDTERTACGLSTARATAWMEPCDILPTCRACLRALGSRNSTH